ncbi:unnamed protein product [Closterium sp. NIES-65]|nr:unnamed protein product [Closterium sp. NIES-65]
MDLDHFGGTFGGNRKPTPFMCLILKMLQIQPEKEIVVEFIKNSDYKYVRLLGAFYLRLVGKPMDVYQYLEPLYNDYRKVRRKLESGMFVLSHVDEFIQELLTLDSSCDITSPPCSPITARSPPSTLYFPLVFVLSHVDEFIEELLTLDSSCDIALPRIPRRYEACF